MQLIRKIVRWYDHVRYVRHKEAFWLDKERGNFERKINMDREMEKKFKLKDEKIDSVCVCMCERA